MGDGAKGAIEREREKLEKWRRVILKKQTEKATVAERED